MGSDGTGTRRRAPPVNGLSKEKEGAPQPVVPAPPRLLTLPTVLTIGRVAAVPFLISSKRFLVYY
jgi:CDP-diacylglycerol--glycerol-3-phosphate 3-phosphatidyltransferase